MNNYNNSYTEVYTILSYLDENELKKIPKDVLEIIKENRNKEYSYSFDINEDIYNQPMLRETKAILFNMFRDYLCTEEQRTKIKRMQREDRLKEEMFKSLKYKGNKLI